MKLITNKMCQLNETEYHMIRYVMKCTYLLQLGLHGCQRSVDWYSNRKERAIYRRRNNTQKHRMHKIENKT